MHNEFLSAEVGAAFRQARRRRGLSQRRFAEALGIAKSTLARLENEPSGIALTKVHAYLELSGFTLAVVDCESDQFPGEREDDFEPMDAAGRRFPAHAEVEWMWELPTYWHCRNWGKPTSARPLWTWRHRE